MAGRATALGAAFRRDPGEARAEIAEAIEEAGGNVARAAHALFLSRRHTTRLIWREGLWGVVDRARAAAYARRQRRPT